MTDAEKPTSDRPAAILAWLPEGVKATTENFDVEHQSKGAPLPNPEKFNSRVEAIIWACHSDRHLHKKFPWIKYDGKTMEPKEIFEAFAILKESGRLP